MRSTFISDHYRDKQATSCQESMISARSVVEFVPPGRSFCARCVPPEGCAESGEGQARTPLLSRISRICLEEPRASEMWQLRSSALSMPTRSAEMTAKGKVEGKEEYEHLGCESDGGPFAEECLYMVERVAVWSRAGRPHLTFTQASRLLSAQWACFSLLSPFVEEREADIEPVQHATLEKGVLLVEAERLTFFTEAGTEHSAGLPFQVSRVWPLTEGLLIERQHGPAENQRPIFLPLLFTLAHPLDEISPILVKDSSSHATTKLDGIDKSTAAALGKECCVDAGFIPYARDPALRPVQVCEAGQRDAQLLLTCDAKTGSHRLWLLRRASAVDWEPCLQQHYAQYRQSMSVSKSLLSDTCERLAPPCYSNTSFSSTMAAEHDSVLRSTPYPQRFGTPGLTRSMAGVEAQATGQLIRPRHCMEALWTEPPQIRKSNCNNASTLVSSTPLVMGTKPDVAPIVEAASKAFIVQDMAGTRYLCYLLPNAQQLRCLPLRKDLMPDNDSVGTYHSEQLRRPELERVAAGSRVSFGLSASVFGNTKKPVPSLGYVVINASDAVYISALKLTAVLETPSDVMLYTGVRKVCKVGLQQWTSSIPSAFRAQPQESPFKDMCTPHQFSVVNDRGNLFTNQATTSALHSLQFFSPMGAGGGTLESVMSSCGGTGGISESLAARSITNLRDPTSTGFTVEFLNSSMIRVYLPHFCGCYLVNACLVAMRAVLPHEACLNLLVRWYAVRNAPGAILSVSPRAEFAALCALLRQLMGWPLSAASQQLPFDDTNQCSPNAALLEQLQTPAKRARQTHTPTHHDWEWLLSSSSSATSLRSGSSAAEEVRCRLRYILPPELVATSPLLSLAESCSSAVQSLDMNAPLAKHLPLILSTLHLVYEECKLNTQMSSCSTLGLLAALLHLMQDALRAATGAKLLHGGMHYSHDFPEDCAIAEAEFGRARFHLCESGALVAPTSESERIQLPDLHAWLEILLREDAHKESILQPFPYLPNVNDNCRLIIGALVSFCRVLSGQCCRVFDRFLQVLCVPFKSDNRIKNELATLELTLTNLSGPAQRLVAYLNFSGFRAEQLDSFPLWLQLALREALSQVRTDPPSECPASTYALAGRPDLAAQLRRVAETEVKAATKHFTLPLGNGANAHAFNPSTLQQPRTFDATELTAMGEAANLAMAAISDQTRVEEQAQVPGLLRLLESDPALQLVFYGDLRLREVHRLLRSDLPIRLRVGGANINAAGARDAQLPEHRLAEDREAALAALAVRTTALPLGRAMLGYGLVQSVRQQSMLQLPRLCLSGRADPHGTTVELSRSEYPAQFRLWPDFHNGVAAGLSLSRYAVVDNSFVWQLIKSRVGGGNSAEATAERAGLLLGLGLNGHLNKLVLATQVRQLLERSHELTQIGVLLGLAAGQRGSKSETLTRLLALHLRPLLPVDTAQEAEHPRTVQAAAAMAIGLLYQGSAHRHMGETLLKEMARPPSSADECGQERELMATSCGLALGLVMLCRGPDSAASWTDLNIADRLYAYMVGGRRYHSGDACAAPAPSCQVLEGDRYSPDVTASGATMALGLMFLASDHPAVVNWLRPPDTAFLLEAVRPDFLTIRALASGLVTWHRVLPSAKWLAAQQSTAVRRCLRHHLGLDAARRLHLLRHDENEPHSADLLGNLDDIDDCDDEVDIEMMLEAYLATLAGAALALGLRFAGTGTEVALATLNSAFSCISMTPALAAQRSSFARCEALLLLAASLVGAGSGELGLVRVLRFFRADCGAASAAVSAAAAAAAAISQGDNSATQPAEGAAAAAAAAAATAAGLHGHGCHQIYAMALGLLFLGGGRYTLNNQLSDVAVLACAICPILPVNAKDNRHYLQAFRHLYALACRPALLCPVDLASNRVCFAEARIRLRDCEHYHGSAAEFYRTLPCLIPPIEDLFEVEVRGRLAGRPLCPVTFCGPRGLQLLSRVLEAGGWLFVTQLRAAEGREVRRALMWQAARWPQPLVTWQLRLISAVTRRVAGCALPCELDGTLSADAHGSSSELLPAQYILKCTAYTTAQLLRWLSKNTHVLASTLQSGQNRSNVVSAALILLDHEVNGDSTGYNSNLIRICLESSSLGHFLAQIRRLDPTIQTSCRMIFALWQAMHCCKPTITSLLPSTMLMEHGD